MDVIQAPLSIGSNATRPWLFLAGSIEMGAAIDWQKEITDRLQKTKGTIFNPRRDDWDSSWTQLASDPKFYQQVTWELMAMDVADLVFFNFASGTKSPVTMLEFGICSEKKPEATVLRADQGFWRFGNLEIVASQADPPIHVIHAFVDAVRYLETRLRVKDEAGTIPTAIGSTPADPMPPLNPADKVKTTHHADGSVTLDENPVIPPHDVGRRYADSRNPDAVDPAKSS